MLQFLGISTDPLLAATINKTEHPTISKEKQLVDTKLEKWKLKLAAWYGVLH